MKNLKIISESVNCEAAISIVQQLKPDIAIISINKFEVSFLDGISKLIRCVRRLKILVLTDCLNETILSYLLKSGIHGCLSMNTNHEEIAQALQAIKNGERFISYDIANLLATSRITGKEFSHFKNLSSRELQVVFMIIRGLSPKEVAEQLFLSSKTVCAYRINIFKKLGVKNDVELTLLAIKVGLLEIK